VTAPPIAPPVNPSLGDEVLEVAAETTTGVVSDEGFLDDLDITFVEAGDAVEHIIKMTDDGCGSTCQSACNSC
jgi:FxLD family lantipeptide